MAGRFPTAWLDELYARADIVSVVSGYLSLKKDGRRYWGLCPFHNEKTPSFSVNADLNLYYCFGCKAGGNVVADDVSTYKLHDDFANRLKLTTNEYFGGGPFGAQNVPNLWGIPVCVTTAVTASQIIVGAFKTCGSVVQKGGVAVEATNTDADDFQKNLMTIRAEERLALAVRRPAGFKLLSK